MLHLKLPPLGQYCPPGVLIFYKITRRKAWTSYLQRRDASDHSRGAARAERAAETIRRNHLSAGRNYYCSRCNRHCSGHDRIPNSVLFSTRRGEKPRGVYGVDGTPEGVRKEPRGSRRDDVVRRMTGRISSTTTVLLLGKKRKPIGERTEYGHENSRRRGRSDRTRPPEFSLPYSAPSLISARSSIGSRFPPRGENVPRTSFNDRDTRSETCSLDLASRSRNSNF